MAWLGRDTALYPQLRLRIFLFSFGEVSLWKQRGKGLR
ncbi:hypothetical protein yrohd0001_27670 [Yersinia rohdei ATCC 43380]|nr:hypothetical protein yrohd0001_27670 [Yersinia rohdei ATCC 43380]